MMQQMKRLKDVYTLFNKNIWGYIRDVAETNDFKTWLTSQKAEDLDVSFLSEYGDKPISNLVENLLQDGELSQNANTMLARYIYNRFINNWLHKLSIEQSQYELFKPYNITTNSSETNANTHTKTGTVSELHDIDNTGTDNRSIGISESVTLSGKDTTENTGTQTEAKTGTETTTSTGTQTVENTGTQTTNDTGTQVVENTGTQANSSSGTDTTNTDVTNDNNVFGFNTNSATGVPQSKQVTDSDVTVTKSESSTRTVNIQAERTDNLQSELTNNLNTERTDDLTNQRTDNLQNQRTDALKEETTYGKVDTKTGSNTDNRTINLNENIEKTTTNNLTDTDSGTNTIQTTRVGNIGNILYQDILEKENNFWNDFNFTKSIFEDVVSIIALPIYQIDI